MGDVIDFTEGGKKHPKHVTEYIDKFKQAKRISDTIRLAHPKAYIAFADKYLLNEKGEIDYSKLDKDPELADLGGQYMSDVYIKEINRYLGTDINPKDIFQRDMLMQIAGVTQTLITNQIRKNKSKYTAEVHEGITAKLMDQVRDRIYSSAASHLRDEHVKDFLKYWGLEDLIDNELMKADDIPLVHQVYDKHGTATKELIDEAFGKNERTSPIFYKKKKKPEELEAADDYKMDKAA